MQEEIKNNNIYEGFIAIRERKPVFVYDVNRVVNFTTESTSSAFMHTGKAIKAEILLHQPSGEKKARIVLFTGGPAIAPAVTTPTSIEDHFAYLRSIV